MITIPYYSADDSTGVPVDDEVFYTRCRRAMLRLSADLLKAAEHRQEYAPFLLEAMHNALNNLLFFGDESDLLLLEQWLDEGNPSTLNGQTSG